MQREDLLEHVRRLGWEFRRREMYVHCQKLRLYSLALRKGLAPPSNVVEVRWDEEQVVDWLKVLRLPPYEGAYEVRARGSCCGRCLGQTQVEPPVRVDQAFPGGTKLRCGRCGAIWLESGPPAR